ncbi:hypothetical protein PVK06_017511 [Gossypium arboreum]|uniref:Uncharacterized protein n=1 Tax=Gossypium arboreum TaxID=29729 RepID=A0ABR0Q3T5_GOSAR|nr:hypothetical protein PVK06_017511 [Gossypium arboreum]
MAPTRFILSSDGSLAVNPSVLIFDKQNSLLTSWLLSTISSSFLSSFKDVRTTHDVWLMANSLFAADSSTKQSQLCHKLHSFRKVHVPLSGPLPFQRLVDALLDCEAQQVQSVQKVFVATNTVEGPPLLSVDVPRRGGFVPGMNGRDDERREDTVFGQNWGISSQNWRPSFWLNYGGDNWVPREPHVGLGNHGFNLFVQRGDGPHTSVDPMSYDNGHEVGPNRNAMDFKFCDESLGHSYDKMASRPHGASGLIRSRPTDGQIVSGPSANCIGIDRS